MQEFEVVNVKLSIKLQNLEYDNIIKLFDESKINVSPNFIVLFEKFTYTIFRPDSKNGVVHCNITKFRSFSKISEAINLLKALFPTARIIEKSIDNITAKNQWNEKVNLEYLFQKLRNICQVKYNLQKFPALFIRIPHSNRFVTIFVFASGKIVCVGAKTEEELDFVKNWIVSKFSE